MLRVLGRTSSINVRKVLWTLEEIGASFEHDDRWATPAHPSTAPEFLRLNPNGLVPVIEDENGVLWESNTICRYLAQTHGRADLLPADAAGRARVEMWMDWQATQLNSAWRYAFLALVRKEPGFDDAGQAQRSLGRAAAMMRLLGARLQATQAHLAGPDFTLADVCVGLAVHRCRSIPGAAALPQAVEDYLRQLGERRGFQRYATPETP
jgi:glutathione S-transferase